MATERYALGVGDIYLMVADEIPSTDTQIEASTNFIGSTSGGCSLSYNFDTQTVENDKYQVLDSFKQSEKCGFKGNLLAFDLSTIAKFTANSKVDDTDEKKTVLKLGNDENKLQKVVVRYVHTFSDGKKLRATLIGNSTGGFELSFAKDKETIIPFEISALSQADGTLCTIEIEK